jgi:hypothetical protein
MSIIISDTDVSLVNSTVVHNGAESGGGIFNRGQLQITNSTVAYNSTFVGEGGGLRNDGGTAVLLNVTIAENGGGGLRVSGGTVTLQNTILARNARQPQLLDCSRDVTSLGNNLIEAPTRCPITLQASDLTGTPGLDAFTDDGMPGHGHFPLLSTSQAINMGTDMACPPTDQVGHTRVGRCDIGAIEFQPSDTTSPAITITATPETL